MLTAKKSKSLIRVAREAMTRQEGWSWMNVHYTEYDVVMKVARKVLGYKLREYKEDHEGAIWRGQHNQKLVKEWDVSWHDLPITADFLTKMNPY